jgi:hypothetical protein
LLVAEALGALSDYAHAFDLAAFAAARDQVVTRMLVKGGGRFPNVNDLDHSDFLRERGTAFSPLSVARARLQTNELYRRLDPGRRYRALKERLPTSTDDVRGLRGTSPVG